MISSLFIVAPAEALLPDSPFAFFRHLLSKITGSSACFSSLKSPGTDSPLKIASAGSGVGHACNFSEITLYALSDGISGFL